MFNELIPRRGSILLSEPFMLDELFERSVILLYEHDSTLQSGGVILNQNSSLHLHDFIDEVENENIPLYTGGPVQDCAIFFIHRAFDKIQSGQHLFNDLYWGGDYNRLFELFNQNLLSPQEVKMFV
ncbi:MAG: YqgE/AlgH family protein, partial [Sphingobacterium sp.]